MDVEPPKEHIPYNIAHTGQYHWGRFHVTSGIQNGYGFTPFYLHKQEVNSQYPVDITIATGLEAVYADDRVEPSSDSPIQYWAGTNPLECLIVVNTDPRDVMRDLEEQWEDNFGEVPGIFDGPVSEEELRRKGPAQFILHTVASDLESNLIQPLAKARINAEDTKVKKSLFELAGISLTATSVGILAQAAEQDPSIHSAIPRFATYLALGMTAVTTIVAGLKIGNYFSSKSSRETGMYVESINDRTLIVEDILRSYCTTSHRH